MTSSSTKVTSLPSSIISTRAYIIGSCTAAITSLAASLTFSGTGIWRVSKPWRNPWLPPSTDTLLTVWLYLLLKNIRHHSPFSTISVTNLWMTTSLWWTLTSHQSVLVLCRLVFSCRDELGGSRSCQQLHTVSQTHPPNHDPPWGSPDSAYHLHKLCKLTEEPGHLDSSDPSGNVYPYSIVSPWWSSWHWPAYHPACPAIDETCLFYVVPHRSRHD